jgi:hypothetical protein
MDVGNERPYKKNGPLERGRIRFDRDFNRHYDDRAAAPKGSARLFESARMGDLLATSIVGMMWRGGRRVKSAFVCEKNKSSRDSALSAGLMFARS